MTRTSDRIIPPGISTASEKKLYFIALGICSLLSIALFALRYFPAREALFVNNYASGKAVSVLIPGAVIEDFPALLHRVFDPLFLLMALTPFVVLLHYLHYRRGSMSIYLMRRLPDRKLLHQQCWTLPLIALGLTALTTLLLLFFYFLIYLFATPAQCLPMAYRRF